MPRRRTPKPEALPPGRAAVPKNPAEEAARGQFAAIFNGLADELRARNLSNAVLLAQQAACGYGPLVDQFSELGRVWSHLLSAPAKPKRGTFRVVEGGQS